MDIPESASHGIDDGSFVLRHSWQAESSPVHRVPLNYSSVAIHTEKEGVRRKDSSRNRSPDIGIATILWFLAPFLFGSCTVAIILSLPFFPSHDGPVHLYYVDVLRGLLSHRGPYPKYFEIKSYVNPYMAEYYSLFGLERFFSPLMSEKLLICAYALTFISSFYYLLHSITNVSGPWALVGALFSINLYIYMGFVNYALGTAICLFVAGLWIRWVEKSTGPRSGMLFAAFFVLAITHPVPLAAFLCFACVHLGMLLSSIKADKGDPRSVIGALARPVAVLAVMAVSSGVWVLHFVGHAPKPPGIRFPPRGLFIRFSSEVLLHRLEPPQIYGVVSLIFLALVAITWIGVVLRICKKCAKPDFRATSVIASAILFFILSVAAPTSMSGGGLFRERFSIYWVTFLIASAAAIKPPRWCTSAVGVIALAGAIAILYSQWQYLSNTARNLNNALNVPLVKPGSVGAIIGEPGRTEEYIDPYTWGAASFFRESQAILSNAPWMDLKTIMLRPKSVDPWTYEDEPRYVPGEILAALNEQKNVRLDFLVQYGAAGPHTKQVIKRLQYQAVSTNAPEIVFYSRADVIRNGRNTGAVLSTPR